MTLFDAGNDQGDGANEADPFAENAVPLMESIDTWWEWGLVIVIGVAVWWLALKNFNRYTFRNIHRRRN